MSVNEMYRSTSRNSSNSTVPAMRSGSLRGSTESFNRQHVSFAHGLQAQFPNIDLSGGEFELRHRGVPVPTSVSNPAYNSTPIASRAPTPLLSNKQRARSTAIFNSFKDFPKRLRSLFPVRGHGNISGENILLDRSSMSGSFKKKKTSLGAFLNTHKRKLIIGGGILGGVATVGRTV